MTDLDDPPCTGCGNEITPADTIVISPRGPMHVECQGGDDEDETETQHAQAGTL